MVFSLGKREDNAKEFDFIRMSIDQRKHFIEKQLKSIEDKDDLLRKTLTKYTFDDVLDFIDSFLHGQGHYEDCGVIKLPKVDKWEQLLVNQPRAFDAMLNWYRGFLGRQMRVYPDSHYNEYLKDIVSLRYSQK
jgi:hypothetical protein